MSVLFEAMQADFREAASDLESFMDDLGAPVTTCMAPRAMELSSGEVSIEEWEAKVSQHRLDPEDEEAEMVGLEMPRIAASALRRAAPPPAMPKPGVLGSSTASQGVRHRIAQAPTAPATVTTSSESDSEAVRPAGAHDMQEDLLGLEQEAAVVVPPASSRTPAFLLGPCGAPTLLPLATGDGVQADCGKSGDGAVELPSRCVEALAKGDLRTFLGAGGFPAVAGA